MEGKVGFQSTGIFDEAGSQKVRKSDDQESAGASPLCPRCGSKRLYRDGLRYLSEGLSVQRWLCRDCGYRFSEKPLQRKQEWQINTPNTLLSKRRICAKEAKNLALATEIKTVAGNERLTLQEQELKGTLLQFEFYCKKQGLKPNTTKTFSNILVRLAKRSNNY